MYISTLKVIIFFNLMERGRWDSTAIKLDKFMILDVLGEFPQVAGPMEQKVKALIQQYNNTMIADKLTVE